jgi:hypothetical protein
MGVNVYTTTKLVPTFGVCSCAYILYIPACSVVLAPLLCPHWWVGRVASVILWFFLLCVYCTPVCAVGARLLCFLALLCFWLWMFQLLRHVAASQSLYLMLSSTLAVHILTAGQLLLPCLPSGVRRCWPCTTCLQAAC